MLGSLSKICTRAASGLALVAVLTSVAAFLVLGLGPRSGRYQVATVLSASMRPTVTEGSIVVVTPMAARDIGVGDVVMYQIPVEDRQVVTHRVVEVLEGGDHPVIRTKGDANDEPDAWTARLAGGPVWKVRADIPKLGYGVNALRTPVAQRICVLLVPVALCAIWLVEIWRPGRPRPRTAAIDPARGGASPVGA